MEQEQAHRRTLDAEKGLLGSVLLDERVLTLAGPARLVPDDFAIGAHGRIFTAMRALADAGSGIDVITLSAELGGDLAQCGGHAYLATLDTSAPTSANAEHYAGLVSRASSRRRLTHELKTALSVAQDEDTPVEEALAGAQRRVLDLHRPGGQEPKTLRSGLQRAGKRWEERHAHPAEVTGVPTGLYELDRMTAGLQPGQLAVLAGKTSRGKTSLALQILIAAARGGFPGILFSLEMPEEQITDRLVSTEGGVDGARLRSGWLRDDDWARVGHATSSLSNLPVWIADASAPTLFDMRAAARRVQAREKKLGLVVVDYLQLVKPASRGENREQAVAEIGRGLKALARDLAVPVLALSQFSRKVDTENRRPRVSDLRESGALEQESDVIVLLHSQDRGGDCSQCGPGVVEVIVDKQRIGPTGTVHASWEPEFTRFGNLGAPPRTDWQNGTEDT